MDFLFSFFFSICGLERYSLTPKFDRRVIQRVERIGERMTMRDSSRGGRRESTTESSEITHNLRGEFARLNPRRLFIIENRLRADSYCANVDSSNPRCIPDLQNE